MSIPVRLLFALITLLLLAPACTRAPVDDYDLVDPATISPEADPSPTPPQTTTEPATSPEAAASSLLAAWRAGDRAEAAKVASSPAVDFIFTLEPGPTQSRGCDQVQALRDCAFRYGDSLLRLKIGQSGAGWIVQQAESF